MNPILLGLLFRFLPILLRQKQPDAKAQYRVLSDKDAALSNLKKKKGAVTVLLGTRGMGKTELAYRLAEFLGRKTYAVSPEQRPPPWIERIKPENILEVKPWSTVICDDLPAWASNRDYNEALVQSLEKLIPMVRHEKCIQLIFSTQSAAQADKYILDCDMAFLKPLGLFKDDFERPNIAKIYRTHVDAVFEGKNDYFIVRHAYMWSRSYKGLIEIKKASAPSVSSENHPSY